LLEETAAKMRELIGPSGRILVLDKDLASETGCKETVEDTVSAFGSIYCH